MQPTWPNPRESLAQKCDGARRARPVRLGVPRPSPVADHHVVDQVLGAVDDLGVAPTPAVPAAIRAVSASPGFCRRAMTRVPSAWAGMRRGTSRHCRGRLRPRDGLARCRARAGGAPTARRARAAAAELVFQADDLDPATCLFGLRADLRSVPISPGRTTWCSSRRKTGVRATAISSCTCGRGPPLGPGEPVGAGLADPVGLVADQHVQAVRLGADEAVEEGEQ